MKFHRYCVLFPEMTPDEFAELCEGIRRDGQREDIITFNGEILDGRNRFNACEVAKLKPRFKPFKGTEKQALDFVVAKNFERRHLTIGQRASIGLEIANCRNSDTSISDAAKIAGVSRDTMQTMKRVKKVAPKLAKKVAAGTMTLNEAKTKITMPRPRREFDPYSSGVALSINAKTEAKTDTSDKRSSGQIVFEMHMKNFKHLSGGAVSWDSIRQDYQKAWRNFADDLTAMFA